jgi:hypothetical protein
MAANEKLGALLQRDGSVIWVEGLYSWPDGFYFQKDDMPVFVQKPGELPRAGIPVASEEERDKAKWRYLLRDAKWTVLD